MPSNEPSPGDADTTQTLSRNHVVVTGAGFTRAFVPGAPLLVDDFNNNGLEARVRGLPNASRLLDWERSLDERGRIDIERLMTRLDALMPYDYAINVVNLSRDDSEAEMTRRRYRSVLGDIPDQRFHFGGALEWVQHLSL